MTGESKKIGKYTCYKATYEKEVEEATFSFGNFNQAQNTPKKKKMKKVNVVAWFTPEIPIATGPSRYGGLPGLILEVSDDQTTLLKNDQLKKNVFFIFFEFLKLMFSRFLVVFEGPGGF